MNNYALPSLVFIVGYCTMAVQLLAGRILAPFFGDSVIVWGSIIGVMILALSAGYYSGGFLADRLPAKKYLFYTVIAFAASILFLLFLKDIGFFHPLLAAIALTFLPGLFSGMTMPFALVLHAKKLSELGVSYGSLSATSAIGSVIGVFSTIFLLLPYLGVQKTILLLFVLSLLALSCLKRQFLIVLLVIPFFFIHFDTPVNDVNVSYLNQTVDVTLESPYGPVRVHDIDGIRSLIVNGGIMSKMDLSNPLKELEGWDYLTCMQDFVADKQEVYVIGLGAGTLSQRFIAEGKNVVAVELNPVVERVAREYFGLYGVETHVADARYDLQEEYHRYGAITMDVMHYDKRVHTVPPHLLTREFFLLAKSRLKSGGVLVIHLPVTSDNDLLLRVENTLLEVFRGYQTRDCGGLQVIAASDNYESAVPHDDVKLLTDDLMLSALS